MPDLVWTRAAESDLQEIFAQCEDAREGSGVAFMSLVDAALSLVRQFPEMAPLFDPPMRRLVLHGRRHGLFYTLEARGLVLHAVADLRRDPEELRRRLRRITGR
jgi:plasmid stabilization system protein ParE